MPRAPLPPKPSGPAITPVGLPEGRPKENEQEVRISLDIVCVAREEWICSGDVSENTWRFSAAKGVGVAACSTTNRAPYLLVVGLVVRFAGGVCARADVPLPPQELPATFHELAVYDGHTPQPGPGSLSLFLATLASFRALRVGRSLKNVHLGALPDWYHDGVPAQIGHAAPADLQTLPAARCPFETPVTQPPHPREDQR